MAIFNSYVKLPEGSILIYSKQCITLHFAQKLAKPGGVSDLNWFQVAQQLLTWYRKITLLRAIPTVTLLCHSFWQLIWKYIRVWHIFSDILFWHSFLAFYPASILKFFPASLLALYLAFYLTVYSGILSGIYSDILFCHAIWHSFWHMIMYLAHLLTFLLAFYLVYIRRFFVVEVRRGTLWCGACSWGPEAEAEEAG